MEQILDHDARAKARLAEQYKGKAKFAGVLAALNAQIQDLEDAFWGLYTERLIPNAVGEQLDRIGVVVNLPRQSLDDATYRQHITATIALNRSSGTAPEIINVIGLLAPPGALLTLEEQHPAAFALIVSEEPLTPGEAVLMNSFLKRAKAAGVGAAFEWFESPSAEVFRLDSGPGLDQGHLGGAL